MGPCYEPSILSYTSGEGEEKDPPRISLPKEGEQESNGSDSSEGLPCSLPPLPFKAKTPKFLNTKTYSLILGTISPSP